MRRTTHLLAYIFLILITLMPMAASAGHWQSYTYADQYRRVVHMGQKLFVLKGGSLAIADAHAQSIERQLTRLDGLSSISIFDICYSTELDRLAIVHDNGMIDVMRPDGTISTIPDLNFSPLPGHDKELLSVREQQGLLFLHFAFGFMVVDLEHELALHTFDVGHPVSCAWAYDGHWFFSCPDGTYSIAQRGTNPHLASQWQRFTSMRVTQAIVLDTPRGTQCWLQTIDQKLCRQTPGNYRPEACTEAKGAIGLSRIGRHHIMTVMADSLALFDTNLGIALPYGSPVIPGQRQSCFLPGASSQVSAFAAIREDAAVIAMLHPDLGLRIYSRRVPAAGRFLLEPLHNAYLPLVTRQQSSLINRLVVGPDGEVGMSQIPKVISGYGYMMRLNGFLTTARAGDSEWRNLTADQLVANYTGSKRRLVGLSDFIADPNHPSRYWFGSLEDGITCIDHDTLFARYNTNVREIEQCSAGCARVASVAISPQDDVWGMVDGVTNGLIVRNHADGRWHKFNIKGLEKIYGFTHLMVARHNDSHKVWGCIEFRYKSCDVFCYDYGSSIDDESDDRLVTFSTLIPTDGSSQTFTPYYNRGISEGPDGSIWLLNTSGLYVIDDPESAFTRPGHVRTVIKDVIPTAIAFDPAGYLWVSTEKDGLYLLTSDGRQQLHHFTTDNTPFGSDCIESLALDTISSTLWLATAGQILTYSYDSREFAIDPDRRSTAAGCYPTSVGLHTRSVVNVFGLSDHTPVTITNSQGRILIEDTALGGIITIDTSALPVGTYTVSGTDREGYLGQLVTFCVSP